MRHTILDRLIEKLDFKIGRLREAKKHLQSRNWEDKKLDRELNRLVSIRNRLKNKNPTDK